MATMVTRTPGPGAGRAFWRATLVGTGLQVATVVCGHYVPALKALFADLHKAEECRVPLVPWTVNREKRLWKRSRVPGATIPATSGD